MWRVLFESTVRLLLPRFVPCRRIWRRRPARLAGRLCFVPGVGCDQRVYSQRPTNASPRVALTVFRSHSATSFSRPRYRPHSGCRVCSWSDVWQVHDHARFVKESATSSWRSVSVAVLVTVRVRLTALPTHRVRCHSGLAGSPPSECSTPVNEARDIGKRRPARNAGGHPRGRPPR